MNAKCAPDASSALFSSSDGLLWCEGAMANLVEAFPDYVAPDKTALQTSFHDKITEG